MEDNRLVGAGQQMNPEQEEELLLHAAAGTDPLTAMAARSDDDDEQQATGNCGCLVMLLAAVGLTFSVLSPM